MAKIPNTGKDVEQEKLSFMVDEGKRNSQIYASI